MFALKKAIPMAIFLCMGSTTVFAGTVEDSIRSAIAPMMEGNPIESIAIQPQTGLYELVTQHGIFYSDKRGTVLIQGALIDVATKTNLTDKRWDELGQFEFSKLPLHDAVKTVHGDGSRVLVTFEDPNCGYCHKLKNETDKLRNVTIYTFLIPILSPDSKTKSEAIWCSANPSQSLGDVMSGKTIVSSETTCTNPIESNLALSQKLRIRGTPAIYFQNNTKIAGYANTEALENKLSEK